MSRKIFLPRPEVENCSLTSSPRERWQTLGSGLPLTAFVDFRQEESHRTIDPLCLENPRPEGAESFSFSSSVASLSSSEHADQFLKLTKPAVAHWQHIGLSEARGL